MIFPYNKFTPLALIKVLFFVFVSGWILPSEVVYAGTGFQDDPRFSLNPGMSDTPIRRIKHKIVKSSSAHTDYRIQVLAEPTLSSDLKRVEKQSHQPLLEIEKHKGLFKYVSAPIKNRGDALHLLHNIRSYEGFENSFIVTYHNGFRLNADGTLSAVQYQGLDNRKEVTKPNVVEPIKKDTLKKELRVTVPAYIPHEHAVIRVKSIGRRHILDTLTPVQQYEEDSIANDSLDPQQLLKKIKGPEHLGSGVIPIDTLNARRSLFSSTSERILQELELPFFNRNLLVIFFVLIMLLLNFLLIAAFLLINRSFIKRRIRNDHKYRILYAENLAGYIFDESANPQIPEPFIHADTDFKKDILIQEMISVIHNVAGDAEEKITALYYKLELHHYSIQKLNNRKWYIKALAMRELAAFNVSEAAAKVETYIHHKQQILQQEAILCLVRLSPNHPFGFLDHYKGVFTRWAQLNTYATVKNYKLDIPEFSKWFMSVNPSVVQFAVDMVSANRQTEATLGFEKLLNHSDEGVRESVVKAIGEMQLTNFSENLILLFARENFKMKRLILQTMGKLGDVILLNFLSDTVLKNNDLAIRLQAAKSLVEVGPLGLMRMQILLLNQDKDVQMIYNHVTDKRI